LPLSKRYVKEFFSIYSPSWIVGILRDSPTRSAGTGSDPNVSIVASEEWVPAAPTKQRVDHPVPSNTARTAGLATGNERDAAAIGRPGWLSLIGVGVAESNSLAAANLLNVNVQLSRVIRGVRDRTSIRGPGGRIFPSRERRELRDTRGRLFVRAGDQPHTEHREENKNSDDPSQGSPALPRRSVYG